MVARSTSNKGENMAPSTDSPIVPPSAPKVAGRKRKVSAKAAARPDLDLETHPETNADAEPEIKTDIAPTAEPEIKTDIAPTTDPVAETADENTQVAAIKTKKKTQRKKKTDDCSSVVSTVASSIVSSVADGQKKKKRGIQKKKMNCRTPSSYVLFSIDHRKVVVESNPDLSLGEVSKLCGSKWKTLSEEERIPWVTKAEDLKLKRRADIEAENTANPPKKKRTPSSYLLFAMEHRKIILEKTPDMGIGQVSKQCGAAWKILADDKKQDWKNKATALKNESGDAANVKQDVAETVV